MHCGLCDNRYRWFAAATGGGEDGVRCVVKAHDMYPVTSHVAKVFAVVVVPHCAAPLMMGAKQRNL